MKIWIGLFFSLIVVYLAYIALSWIAVRLAGVGVMKRAQPDRKSGWVVHLTFDDGPHPEYTPKLLALLKRYGARATFFVVGEAARAHPDLIRQIAAHGHEIGLHNVRHVPNWIHPPWRTGRELRRLADDIEQLAGRRPTLYRPPWGILGLLDLIFVRGFRVVLWSIMPRDWERRSDPRTMKWRILHRLAPGEIILLHDSGETFGADPKAPGRMLVMLEDLFETLQEIGLTVRFEPVGEWLVPGSKARANERTQDASNARAKSKMPLRVRLYFAYEDVHRRVFRYRPLMGRHGFLFYEKKRYPGPDVEVDGTFVRHGEVGLNLHFNNRLLFRALTSGAGDLKRIIALKREAEVALRLLARFVDERMPEVRGVFGYSALHRGIKPFGFAVKPMRPTPYLSLSSAYMRTLLALLHPEGAGRLKTEGDLEPHWVVMPRAVLLSRYGRKADRRNDERHEGRADDRLHRLVRQNGGDREVMR
ncbi:MAG: polysaccharide deacetylase family protein [Hydrogenibacillus sp.]|nr:polysaccharide deacetylase family protein [Hydrogenibacillus sp.]